MRECTACHSFDVAYYPVRGYSDCQHCGHRDVIEGQWMNDKAAEAWTKLRSTATLVAERDQDLVQHLLEVHDCDGNPHERRKKG